MAAKNVRQIACYVNPKQHTALKALSARTRVPVSAYLREAVDDLIAKYTRRTKGAGA